MMMTSTAETVTDISFNFPSCCRIEATRALRWIKKAYLSNVYCPDRYFTASRNNIMIRIADCVLVLLALIVVLCATNDALSFSIVGTLTAILLIVAFGIAATGWTIRHDN